jgi:hypothetical protein
LTGCDAACEPDDDVVDKVEEEEAEEEEEEVVEVMGHSVFVGGLMWLSSRPS